LWSNPRKRWAKKVKVLIVGLNYHNYRNDLEELSYPEEEVNSICQILSKKTVQGKDPKRKRRKEKRDFEKSTI
jgi:hypothetical protein